MAPLAVSVTDCPLQLGFAELTTVNTGSGLTTTRIVKVSLHPLLYPVTVYTEVTVGVTIIFVLAITLGVCHTYEVAPPAVSDTDCPLQICVWEAMAKTVGVVIAVILRVADAVHPEADPITV